MDYGYARCSTNESRQDITRQIRELTGLGVRRENIYLEYESGGKEDRIQYHRLLDALSAGDTIITTEVPRLSRSTKQLCELIEMVKEKHLRLIIQGSITVDCREREMDPVSQAFLEMAGVFAALERNMTIARVKSGIQNARAKGKRIGRPETTFQDIPDRFLRYYALYQAQAISVAELSRLARVSRPTTYKYIDLIEKEKERV